MQYVEQGATQSNGHPCKTRDDGNSDDDADQLTVDVVEQGAR